MFGVSTCSVIFHHCNFLFASKGKGEGVLSNPPRAPTIACKTFEGEGGGTSGIFLPGVGIFKKCPNSFATDCSLTAVLASRDSETADDFFQLKTNLRLSQSSGTRGPDMSSTGEGLLGRPFGLPKSFTLYPLNLRFICPFLGSPVLTVPECCRVWLSPGPCQVGCVFFADPSESHPIPAVVVARAYPPTRRRSGPLWEVTCSRTKFRCQWWTVNHMRPTARQPRHQGQQLNR